MTPPRRGPTTTLAHDLDPVNAVGIFALLSGGLSVLLPYFLGPCVALSGLLLALVAARRTARPSGPLAAATAPVVGALLGWGLLLMGPFGAWRGLALALCCAPLWWRARRVPAFGGG